MSRDIEPTYWGRLKSDENRGLRRGAWYRVVALAPAEVVLDVNRRRVPPDRAALHLVSAPPQTWTVVRGPSDAKGVALALGDRYAVCPSCRNRTPLKGGAPTLRCPCCDGNFRVAWDEWFVGSG